MGRWNKKKIRLTPELVAERVAADYQQIADETEYNIQSIKRFAKEAGITHPKPRRPLSEDYDKIDEMAKAGATAHQISKALGRNWQSVYDYMIEKGFITTPRDDEEADLLRMKFRREKKKKEPERFKVKVGQKIVDGKMVDVYKMMTDVTDEIFETDDIESFGEGKFYEQSHFNGTTDERSGRSVFTR